MALGDVMVARYCLICSAAEKYKVSLLSSWGCVIRSNTGEPECVTVEGGLNPNI